MRMDDLWIARRTLRYIGLCQKHPFIERTNIWRVGKSSPMRYPFVKGRINERVCVVYDRRKPLKYQEKNGGSYFYIWSYQGWLPWSLWRP